MSTILNMAQIFLFSLLFTVSIYSQNIAPREIVDLQTVAHQQHVNNRFSVLVEIHLNIKKNWHINSHTPYESFLIPTMLSFDSTSEYSAGEMIYPAGMDGTLPFSTKKLNLYTERQTITAIVNIAPSYRKKNITINGTVHYQACNDEMCLFPVKRPFLIDVPLDH